MEVGALVQRERGGVELSCRLDASFPVLTRLAQALAARSCPTRSTLCSKLVSATAARTRCSPI